MYQQEEKIVVWWTLSGIPSKKQMELIDYYQDISKVKMCWVEDKVHIQKILTQAQYQKANSIQEKDVNQFLAQCDKERIFVLTWYSRLYPEQLRNISDPPTVLFCMGNIRLLSTPMLAIVGTRRMTKYGAEVTEMFAKDIACNGITIISGLADGVDSKAHSSALAVKGKTIAVLGSGLHHVYPSTNIGLAQQIIEHDGLLISEYLPEEKAKVYYFPIRNRIIAGLSQGVLITEATCNSGSMHTKKYALEYGKNLYIVPARITDIYSAGCNQTIQELQGSVVLSSNDILRDYPIAQKEKEKQNIVQLTVDESIILDVLSTNELHFDEILAQTKKSAKELNTLLLRMEMRGMITKLPGNYYRK